MSQSIRLHPEMVDRGQTAIFASFSLQKGLPDGLEEAEEDGRVQSV